MLDLRMHPNCNNNGWIQQHSSWAVASNISMIATSSSKHYAHGELKGLPDALLVALGKGRCDEGKQACSNCSRGDRGCGYKYKKSLESEQRGSIESPRDFHCPPNWTPLLVEISAPSRTPSVRLLDEQQSTISTWSAVHDPSGSLSPDDLAQELVARLESAHAAASPPDLLSREIKSTKTMDILTARTAREASSLQQPFTFFINALHCPAVTPDDDLNWGRAKRQNCDAGNIQ